MSTVGSVASALLISGVLATMRVSTTARPQGVALAAFSAVDTAHDDTIRAAIYYPTADAERDTTIALQSLHLAPGGRYLQSEDRRPLIVMSHGTGGDEYGHWDSAEALARAGYIVVAIRHAGDNSRDHSALGTDRYLYGRPEQVELLLDRLLADSAWAQRIDSRHIGFFGYSAGGFTGLELLGARPRLERLVAYCDRHPRDPLYCADGLRGRFRMTGRYAPPRRDARIRAAVLWAPAFSFLFDSATLAKIRTPMLIVRGTSDSVVIEPDNVEHLRRSIPANAEFQEVQGAGHYTLLPPCGAALARVVPEICTDPPGVSRRAIHEELDNQLVSFFTRALELKAK